MPFQTLSPHHAARFSTATTRTLILERWLLPCAANPRKHPPSSLKFKKTTQQPEDPWSEYKLHRLTPRDHQLDPLKGIGDISQDDCSSWFSLTSMPLVPLTSAPPAVPVKQCCLLDRCCPQSHPRRAMARLPVTLFKIHWIPVSHA